LRSIVATHLLPSFGRWRKMCTGRIIVRYTARLVVTALLTATLAFAPAVGADFPGVAGVIQSQKPADAPRITRPTSKPYTGDLSIFEDPKRAENLQINRVMDLLAIKQGSNVADIGAGSGWFTIRAATRVGEKGTVYAVEINPDYLSYIQERAVDQKLSNIRTILGKEDDPLLPRDSVDAVLILKTYHEIAQPILLLSRLREALKSGALLGIIDRNGNGKDHGISSRVVIKEAAEAGFSLVEQYDFVKPDGMDYFLVFRVAIAAPSH
jgi:SAM-dependent methyltransferase